MKKLDGENSTIPNLKLKLIDSQIDVARIAIEKMRCFPMSGPIALVGNQLSIDPFDVSGLFSFLELDSENELCFFRLRREAISLLESRLNRCTRESKIRAYESLIEHIQSIPVGCNVNSEPAKVDPNRRIELIPESI